MRHRMTYAVPTRPTGIFQHQPITGKKALAIILVRAGLWLREHALTVIVFGLLYWVIVQGYCYVYIPWQAVSHVMGRLTSICLPRAT